MATPAVRLRLTTVSLALILFGSVVTTARSQTLADLIQRIRPSVAFVLARGGQGAVSGTAFVVHPDGLLLTAHHVVNLAREISVTLPGRQPQRAVIVASDPNIDIAVLQISLTGLRPLQLGDSAKVRAGDEIIVAGYPLASILGSYEITVTRGIINAVRTSAGLIQMDAPTNPGMSGGPVVNLRGEVVGIAVMVIRGAQAINFAVPVNSAKQLIPRDVTSSAPPGPISPIAPPPQIPGAKPGALVASEHITTKAIGHVQYTLEIDKQIYEPAEHVELKLLVSNTGTSEVTFSFLTNQLFDFIILQGTQEIARWSTGRQFGPLDRPLTLSLQGGLKFEWRTRWKQIDQNDDPVSAGRYIVVAYFLSWPSPVSLSLTVDKIP